MITTGTSRPRSFIQASRSMPLPSLSRRSETTASKVRERSSALASGRPAAATVSKPWGARPIWRTSRKLASSSTRRTVWGVRARGMGGSRWGSWGQYLSVDGPGGMRNHPVMRFLLGRTDALGDVVVSLPVMERILSRLPGAEVHWLVRPYAAPLLQGLGAGPPAGGGPDLAALMRSLAPDAVLNLCHRDPAGDHRRQGRRACPCGWPGAGAGRSGRPPTSSGGAGTAPAGTRPRTSWTSCGPGAGRAAPRPRRAWPLTAREAEQGGRRARPTCPGPVLGVATRSSGSSAFPSDRLVGAGPGDLSGRAGWHPVVLVPARGLAPAAHGPARAPGPHRRLRRLPGPLHRAPPSWPRPWTSGAGPHGPAAPTAAPSRLGPPGPAGPGAPVSRARGGPSGRHGPPRPRRPSCPTWRGSREAR